LITAQRVHTREKTEGQKGFTEVEVTEEAKCGIQLQFLVRRKDLA
jgi:hypothetical protein